MKYFVLCLIIILLSCSSKSGQSSTTTFNGQTTTTIVLIRHAEKETTGRNPTLSSAGMARAEKLPQFLNDIKPDAFYSTNFIRTKQTLESWAKATGKTIQLYDPSKPDSVATMLKRQKGKTMIVVGHSNTIPGLINAIIGKSTYSDLPETEFRKVFIVTITDKQTSVEERIFEP